MSAAPLIELRDLRKVYATGEVAVEALKGLTLSIAAGEFVAVMGQSGSGKSTLMHILGCLDRPTDGAYLFRGQDVAALDPDEIAELRRDAFGFIFQSYNLITTSTAVENVEMPAVYAGTSAAARRDRAEELLTTLGLADRFDHRPNQLSGGQQQRVAVARALMNGGQVIFADEPTGALDSRSGAEVMALLKRLNAEGHTIVLITHDRDVASHADRVIELKDGEVVADSDPWRAGQAALHPIPAGGVVEVGGMPAWFSESAEALKMALRSLRVNLFRTVLTLLGIVIGVASVVAMLAVGDGAKQSVLKRISAMGTNLLLVRPGSPNTRGSGGVATLVTDDALAIADLPNVVAAVPLRTGTVTVRYGNMDVQTDADGTWPDFTLVRDWPVADGTFIEDADVTNYAPVVALGKTTAGELFPDGADPIGKYVLMNNVPFQVIGVMSAKGATPWGSDQDDGTFVPLSTASLRLFGKYHLRAIMVLVDDLAQIGATENAINQILTQRHRVTDFRIRNMAAIMEAASETQNTLTVLLGAIAAISLLVGGIGVMNIMLVSVTERTREIGIRVATGARTANILQQFMTEAVVVSGIGGVLGVGLGLGVAQVIAMVGKPIAFSVTPVVLAFSCAFLTGITFGYMPARKAATLDPVVALGAE
jgi:macrolide transport system ATP-binding/permease protein